MQQVGEDFQVFNIFHNRSALYSFLLQESLFPTRLFFQIAYFIPGLCI